MLERFFATNIGRKVWHNLWKIFHDRKPLYQGTEYKNYVELFDQEANDYVLNALKEGTPLMISRFGSVEINALVSYLISQKGFNMPLFLDWIKGRITYNDSGVLEALCNNAGFFPNDKILVAKFLERTISDLGEIDILGSWLYAERHFARYMVNCRKKVNLASFYKPLFWNEPWTKYLENKRVLVIHPFAESIKYQYDNKRELLFENPDVLPKFKELLLIKAVQSIADNKDLPYANWFEALEFMEKQISSLDFDVAIIGCGAYGLPLAAHVKRMGKQAIHMASWTQMLFGIYGTRWEKDSFINEYWIRPSENERPLGLEKVENGCYW